MARKIPANTKNGSRWPAGVSGNPKGAPKRGMSWREIFKETLSMTTDEVAALLESGELAAAYRKMPKGIALKNLVALRVIAAVMFEPQGSLLNFMGDREEGKPTETVNVAGPGGGPQKVEVVVQYADSKGNGNASDTPPETT